MKTDKLLILEEKINLKKGRIMKLPIIFLLASLLISCGGEEKESVEKIIVTKTEKVRVETLSIEKRRFKASTLYPGIIKEWDNFTIAPQFSGTIEYMPYDLNDYIKKGDIIVKINSSILRAQIKQLEISKKNIEISYNRVLKLYNKKLTTKAALDGATTQKENIDAQLNVLHVNLRNSVIRSPFNGYVIKRWKQKGELAAPGMPIITLVELDRVKLNVSVPEKDISKLAKGNVIDIYLEANNKKYQGIVYRISQQSNPSSHTVVVEVELKNIKNFDNEFIFKPGMLSKASVTLIRDKNGIVIPLDSIIKTEKGNFVFKGNNNVAHKVKIDIVATSKDEALVKGDLNKGDKLLIKGMYELSNNSKINIVKENKIKNVNPGNHLLFSCKKEIDSIKLIKQLLSSKLTITDLFKSKDGYNLIYIGELPDFINKCKI